MASEHDRTVHGHSSERPRVREYICDTCGSHIVGRPLEFHPDDDYHDEPMHFCGPRCWPFRSRNGGTFASDAPVHDQGRESDER